MDGEGDYFTAQVVSTHSRLKAAGPNKSLAHREYWVSTHSRLKAAGQTQARGNRLGLVSTHSRLKAAGYLVGVAWGTPFSFNTQPPEGGWVQVVSPHDDVGAVSTHSPLMGVVICPGGLGGCLTVVTTHPRLTAAGSVLKGAVEPPLGFNTQPPEGGWAPTVGGLPRVLQVSTHSRLKAAG